MSFIGYREGLRIIRLFAGLFLYAAGIVMTLQANVGYSPWDVFHQGVAMHLKLSMGEANVLVSVVMVIITALMREHVGVGTLCNMIAIGAFIDIIMSMKLIPLVGNFALGVLMMLGGLFVIGAASFLYIGAGYGSGPRDSLMVVLTKRTRKPVGLCRFCVEGTVLSIGWLLGGYAGWGTIISAFGVGIAVQVVFSILRFDVKTIHQESCYETYTRLKNF